MPARMTVPASPFLEQCSVLPRRGCLERKINNLTRSPWTAGQLFGISNTPAFLIQGSINPSISSRRLHRRLGTSVIAHWHPELEPTHTIDGSPHPTHDNACRFKISSLPGPSPKPASASTSKKTDRIDGLTRKAWLSTMQSFVLGFSWTRASPHHTLVHLTYTLGLMQ